MDFFKEKADVTMFIFLRSNLLIPVVKLVIKVVMRVKILKKWQWLMVHNILVKSYLWLEKIELLKKS